MRRVVARRILDVMVSKGYVYLTFDARCREVYIEKEM